LASLRSASLVTETFVDPDCDNPLVRISAKADYAVRAALELAAAPDGEPVKGERLAEAQQIPLQFLEHILLELKHARLIQARRGARGGYWLARDPAEITVADVIRAVEGPLANIHENAPEELHYAGSAEKLRDVWVAVRAALRSVLENVTLAELAGGELPWRIDAILNNPEAWIKR
jgi:Rrf2 family protein